MKKTCTKCKEEKDFSEYYKDKAHKDGVRSSCKACCSSAAKKYYRSDKGQTTLAEYNKSDARKLSLARYSSSDKGKAIKKKYSLTEKGRVAKTRHRKRVRSTAEGKARHLYHQRQREARKINATPPWLNEKHQSAIKEVYSLSAKRTESTGIEWHVDHIIPLRSKSVSGLHVPWNLQVITATENIKKSNNFNSAG